MKKTLLLLGFLTGMVASAQNVDDQKVNFNYIQLPSNPIKGTTNYNVTVDHSIYTKSNEDSLALFETKLNLCEAQLTSWVDQKRKIDQMYLLEMSKWEKANNAGTLLPQPIKQPYPEMPTLKEELVMPILTEDISEGIVDGGVRLEGFEKGEGGATITIQFSGIQNTKIVEKITGTGATMKYEYTAEYLMPINVKIEVPGQGIILNENFNQTAKRKLINKYDSKYDFEYWQIENLSNFWKSLQQEELTASLSSINALINDRCGFPVKMHATEVYTVKKYKGHNYSDLIDAYTKAKSGYDLVYKSVSRKEAASNLNKAISVWEKALAEGNPVDNKARINDKVIALLYVNLAEAYLWLGDYTKADNYIQKAKISNEGAGKYRRQAKDLEDLMNVLKSRELANQ
jgi:hypothetical protein